MAKTWATIVEVQLMVGVWATNFTFLRILKIAKGSKNFCKNIPFTFHLE